MTQAWAISNSSITGKSAQTSVAVRMAGCDSVPVLQGRFVKWKAKAEPDADAKVAGLLSH